MFGSGLLLGCNTGDTGDVTDDFIAKYVLATDSLDETGNYDGVDQDMTYNGTDAVFNGTSSAISTGIVLGSSPTAFTISCVVHSSVLTTANSTIIGVFNRTFGSHHIRLTTQGDGTIAAWDYDGTLHAVFSSSIVDNQDYHLIFTSDGANYELFVDKVSQGTTPVGSPLIGSYQLIIGALQNYSDIPEQAWYKDFIRNVRIYDRAITPAEGVIIYNEDI